jgi:hypothetical protein
LFAVLLAFSTRYGYHRDELYFRLLGEDVALGYFDTPPLTPMIAKLSIALFGDHVVALRVVPALAAAVAVVLVALTCRELGGSRGAQVLTAFGVACSSVVLIAGHMLLTLTPDLVFWTAAILSVVKAVRDPRWWLAVGVAVGLATYNRQLIALLVIGIAVGLLVVGPRSALASKWLWLGVLIALVLAAPNLYYQYTHDWPQAQMAEALEADDGADNRIMFVPLQFGLLGPPLAVIMVVGLVWLWRRRRRPRVLRDRVPGRVRDHAVHGRARGLRRRPAVAVVRSGLRTHRHLDVDGVAPGRRGDRRGADRGGVGTDGTAGVAVLAARRRAGRGPERDGHRVERLAPGGGTHRRGQRDPVASRTSSHHRVGRELRPGGCRGPLGG